MNKATFTAYAAAAQGDPTGGDHVCVESSDGVSWSCWGRTLQQFKDGNADYKQVAQGQGYTQWANLIVGDGNAGLTLHVTGKCHNQANRILALAGTDVRTAGADAMIMLYFGKYGFDIPGYIERVKTAVATLNSNSPDAISEDDLNGVVAYINRAQQDELEIIEEFFEQAVTSQALNLTADQKTGVAAIYSNFFNERASVEGDPGTFGQQLRPIFLESLTKLQQLLGNDVYMLIFKALPAYAADSLGLK